MKLKAKGKWKKISTDSLKGFSDFISVEELTDYELIGDLSATSIATKKTSDENNGADTLKQKKKQKKKRNKKKKLIDKEILDFTDQRENAKECDGGKEQLTVENERSVVVTCHAVESVSVLEDLTTNNDADKRQTKRKSELSSANEPPNKKQRLNSSSDVSSDVETEERKKLNKKKKKKKKKKKGRMSETEEISLSNYCNTESNETSTEAKSAADMSNWSGLSVPDQVLQNLSELGFQSPTLVQRRVLPVAAHGKSDVIAAAETGSGKTLAFGIPIINLILRAREKDGIALSSDETEAEEDANGPCQAEKDSEDANEEEAEVEEDDVAGEVVVSGDGGDDDDDDAGAGSLFALVLTPTRELAFQIRDHLRSVAKDTGIKCHVVVGGMSIQRQSRILDKDRPEIVVATPGRLWDIYKQGNKHLSGMNFIRCLVIDEADRMVEKFHFEHLLFILAELNQKNSSKDHRQTFMLSATLTYTPPKPQRLKHTKKKFTDLTTEEKLESLCARIGIRGKPKVIDLTPKQRTASRLTETRLVFNAVEDKDLNLFCFLKEHSGRTIVFANSIDCIWRLMRLFTLLEMLPLRLFANMQQKQRLQSVEKFKANPRGLLLATDIAARGLDIPGVEHVIHYEVPKTTESYIHRSGRTARANSEGFSILFIGPKEVNSYRRIMKALERDDLPNFPMNESLLWAAKERVTLARKIELQEYNLKKQRSGQVDQLSKEADLDDSEASQSMTKKDRFRLEQLAKEVGIESSLDDLENSPKRNSQKKKLQQIAKDAGIRLKRNRPEDEDEEYEAANEQRSLKWAKKQLRALLSTPLVSKFGRTKYPTKSGQMIWPQLLESSSVDAIAKIRRKNRGNKTPKDYYRRKT